jgi:protein SCO1/2
MKPKILLTTLCASTLLIASIGLLLVQRSVLRQRGSSALRPTTHQTATAVPPKTFEVHGTIRAVDIANRLLRITHEEIPDYMPAMTMPFSVKNPVRLNGLAPGDSVQFELAVTDTDSWIAQIEKIPTGDGAVNAGNSSTTLQERETERLQVGEKFPDFQLADQDGKPVHLSDFGGKAVVLTFIYTRCPLPNFCPLMSKNFAELQQRLTKELPGKYHLLSITMDPDFDRPEVLKDYASRYDANSADWSFATGTPDQIGFVAGLVGLYYVRENGLISHDLRTALIGPDGKLVHLWKSNVWTPYEVQRMVRETLTGNRDFAAR